MSENNKILSNLIISGNAGNQSAYKEFLIQITPIIRSVVTKKIVPADVEDVLQEILISVHKARHTYDGMRPIMPWLMAIIRFRMIDHLRKHYAQMRHKTSDIEELKDVLADVTSQHDKDELVSDLFQGIDAKNKQILTMMHVEGYTAKEIGTKINMNESAVKVAAHRAIKKIRTKLKI